MLPVLPAVAMPSVDSFPNGQIPTDRLMNVRQFERYDVFLASEAAVQYHNLQVECFTATGRHLGISGGGAYRTLRQQELLLFTNYETPARSGLPASDYRTYKGVKYSRRPGFASAAVPGESNHGKARAIDSEVIDPDTGQGFAIAGDPVVWPWLKANAVALGWSWEFAQEPPNGEPWHLRVIRLPSTPEPPKEDDDVAALELFRVDTHPADLYQFDPVTGQRRHIDAFEGAFRGALYGPTWTDAAKTISLPADVDASLP